VTKHLKASVGAGSAEELPQAGQQGRGLLQDTVILSFEREEAGSRDGMSYLPGSGTQPREGVSPGDDQGRHLDASMRPPEA
jgi:hypothetical protein